jgi:hypothetical protein
VDKIRNVLDSAPHETLHRGNGVVRVLRRLRLRGETHGGGAIGVIAHHGRQQAVAGGIVEYHRYAIAHGGHQGIGGTQVDTDRESVLVRRGGESGLAPFHLQHEEIRRHRGVFGVHRIDTMQLQQIAGALKRLAQGLVGLVDLAWTIASTALFGSPAWANLSGWISAWMPR